MVNKPRVKAFLSPKYQGLSLKYAHKTYPQQTYCRSATLQNPISAPRPDSLFPSSTSLCLSYPSASISPAEATPTSRSRHHPFHHFTWKEINTELHYYFESKGQTVQNLKMPRLLRNNSAANAVWGLRAKCLQFGVITNSVALQQHIANKSEHWLQISSEKILQEQIQV